MIQQRLQLDRLAAGPVGGGSINDTYRMESGELRYFCKVNSATKFPHLFEKERAGLELIGSQGTIRTPRVLDLFEAEGSQLLLMEWIDEGERTPRFWTRFGEELARLHFATKEECGLEEDNYMGSVPQNNRTHRRWTVFFEERRLRPLVRECSEKNLLEPYHVEMFENLYKRLPQIFEDEEPSLLHGDLWSGNFLCDRTSRPVLIDPAVYYGHRCVDLGMTTLFGRCDDLFYEAYHYHSPLPENYREQWSVCNLYPLLIHVLLFGTGYRVQTESILRKFA